MIIFQLTFYKAAKFHTSPASLHYDILKITINTKIPIWQL